MAIMHYDSLTNMAQFFIYNGKIYTQHTIIKVSQSYIDAHANDKEPIWPYYRFMRKYILDNKVYYEFQICKADVLGEWLNYATSFTTYPSELKSLIEDIVVPVEVENMQIDLPKAKKDWEDSDTILAWIIYIAVMIGSLIFKQFYIIWLIATIIFFNYRRKRLQ